MSSRSASTPHFAARGDKHLSVPVAGVQSAVPAEAAANDDRPTPAFSVYGDPLLGMAIASVILFAVMAALIALS